MYRTNFPCRSFLKSVTLNLVAAGVPFPFYFYHGDLYSVLWKSDQNFRPISWARDTVRWPASGYLVLTDVNWSMDIIHDWSPHWWAISFLVFSWAPKVVRKCESKHWFSCGADRWLKATVFLAELAEFSHPRLVWNQNFNCEAHKHNIFHMNLRKTILEPAIAWKLVTCQRITLKNTDLDGSTPEPAIRSSDTSQRIPCFDSCQLITTLMSKMSALSVFLCSQTN